MPETAQHPHSLSPLLYHPEFRFFIIARFFYTMSLRMVATVVAYQLFQITRSSFSIGISGLSEFVPVFFLALYAGYLIDRSDKRTLLLKGILSYSLCVAGLVVLTMPQMAQVLSRSSLPVFFYGIIFCTGVIRAFAGPTSSAIIAQLVPRNILHLASAISSSSFLIASIVGHASAGLFIGWFGVHATFVIILAYVLLAALLLSRIPKKPVVHNPVGVRAWDSVKEGLSFVFRNKIMLGAISLDLFAVLFGGAVALIPEIADRILKVGPQGFGLLNAAIDIGSAVTLLFNTFFPLRRRQGQILLFAVFGFGLCIIVFGLSSFFWSAFLALLVAGMLDGISVVIRGTILQLTTPDQMRGRVSAVNSMFINSSNELGQFESGFTARMLGTVPAVLFGGFMTTLVVIVTWWRAPGLRKFEY
ncbi:MAG: MFS transporter [Chitinophagaceae bacterium]|nr:MAG: MFS transporter [Chitinophagaceae bacterium]